MQRLVECIPNFSEGRNPSVVQSLTAVIQSIEDVYVLDEEMDHDHHRAVITMVGSPGSIAEAAFQCVAKAMALIDLRSHQGGHPRVGATDVVPFVPVRGTTMEECIALAKQVGERIGRELQIPVFLYERAAGRAERVHLEEIRRGGLEGLAARLAAEGTWAPDYGPSRLHPTAGAVVVGARPPLIAYNVNLQSPDLAVAKSIARTVRFSSGGLPCVKAIGLELGRRGLVQVSMNLTNFEETSVVTAFEAVRRQAEDRGVQVVESEVVGLVPQRALLQVAEHVLKLKRFDPSQVLETRLEMVLAREVSPNETDGQQDGAGYQGVDWSASVIPFLDAVAEGTPTPGGGSVAAQAGALACALGMMACRIGPRKGAGDAADLTASEQQLQRLRGRFQALMLADARAYQSVIDAYRLSKADPRRQASIEDNLMKATQVPLETAEAAREAALLLMALRSWAKPSVASDIKVGLLMAVAAIEGGLENVATNLESQSNPGLRDEISTRLGALRQSLVEVKSLC